MSLSNSQEYRSTTAYGNVDPEIWHTLRYSFDRPSEIQPTLFLKHLLQYDVADLKWKACKYRCPERFKEAYLSSTTAPDRFAALTRIIDDAHIRARKFVRAALKKRAQAEKKDTVESRMSWTDIVNSDDICVIDMSRAEFMKGSSRPSVQAEQAALERKRKKDQADSEQSKRLRQSTTDDHATDSTVVDDKAEEKTDTPDKTNPDAEDTAAVQEKVTFEKAMSLLLRGVKRRLYYTQARRRYIVTLMVTGSKIQLGCFDRSAITVTEPIDIFKNPKMFVLVVVALFAGDRRHFGYEPHISLPTELAPHGLLRLPASRALDEEGNPLVEDAVFLISDEAISIEHMIVGRATVVLPVERCCPDIPTTITTPSPLVAKIGWPFACREDEARLICDVRKKVDPRWAAHIPRVECTLDIDNSEELGLLPHYLWKEQWNRVDRPALRFLVVERLEHINDVRSLEEFKSVFLDIVRFHRVAYLKASIIQGDLNTSNLMLKRDADGRAIGVLNDWDMAQHIDDRSKESKSAFGGGTAAFMALDLLRDTKRHQMYRHDLESFIWILIWSVFHLELGPEGTVPGAGAGDHGKPIVNWDADGFNMMWYSKVALLMNGPDVASWKVQEAFKPLHEQWVMPLFKMLKMAHEVQSKRPKRHWFGPLQFTDHMNEETLGGHMTYEKFMEAIGEDPSLPDL
ncbi:hypothetical protein EVG20_g7373 [Dentipellis fragilis]|uniref:Fungal-type protein kinase domain-containing protein n=1 Tax=Dentipellis fragilis TaxID=205917 RepID=A0A4Y9YFU9_9AGAM|nr:hypothetical protein EVG20_g7373 [Dentipellis fragilis]